jgi:hypothetical protein
MMFRLRCSWVNQIRRTPKYEKAAIRWLERYLTEGEPRLQHFAELVASPAWPEPRLQHFAELVASPAWPEPAPFDSRRKPLALPPPAFHGEADQKSHDPDDTDDVRYPGKRTGHVAGSAQMRPTIVPPASNATIAANQY